MVNYKVDTGINKTECQTQSECAQQTHANQKAGAEEQMEMNRQIGGSVAEINVSAGSSQADIAQQKKTTEDAMQSQENSKYDHCVGVTRGSQAGCGKKKRRRRRKSRKSKRKSRKSKRKSRKSKKKSRKSKKKSRRRRKR